MTNALATIQSTTQTLLALGVSDIKSEAQAYDLYQLSKTLDKVSDHIRRVAVTYLMDTKGYTVNKTAEYLQVTPRSIKNISCRANGLGLKEAKRSNGQVPRGVPSIEVEDPTTLSALLPSKRDADNFIKAPAEVKDLVVEYANTKPELNAEAHALVKEIIDPETWEPRNLNQVSKEDMAEALFAIDSEREAMVAEAMVNKMFIGDLMRKYGTESNGAWKERKPLSIILSLVDELTSSERNILLSKLDTSITTVNV